LGIKGEGVYVQAKNWSRSFSGGKLTEHLVIPNRKPIEIRRTDMKFEENSHLK
jgi:hypothetical protein